MSAYIRMLAELHDLIRGGRGDSAEAEKLRDRMDVPWSRLDADEIALVDGLSADLHTLGAKRNAVAADANTEAEFVQFDQAVNEQDWPSALETIRRNESHLPPRTAAYLRGVCWAHLGEAEVAMAFLREAASFEPLAPDEEFWLLMSAAKAGCWAEVLPRAREIARSSANPLLLLAASLVLFRAAMEAAEVNAEVTLQEASDLTERALAVVDAVPADELLDELRAAVLTQMALAYDHFGDRKAAMNACERALQVDPQREAARELLILLRDGTVAANEMDAFRHRIQQRIARDLRGVPTMAGFN